MILPPASLRSLRTAFFASAREMGFLVCSRIRTAAQRGWGDERMGSGSRESGLSHCLSARTISAEIVGELLRLFGRQRGCSGSERLRGLRRLRRTAIIVFGGPALPRWHDSGGVVGKARANTDLRPVLAPLERQPAIRQPPRLTTTFALEF